MLKIMRGFLHAERGATAIEYSLIAGLLFLAIVGGVQALGAGVVNILYTKLVTIL